MHTAQLSHRPRLLALAALPLCALAFGAAFHSGARAAPAEQNITLTAGLYGTEDAVVGQNATYTLVVTDTSSTTDAGALEYGIAFPRAVAAIDTFSDPLATCVSYSTDSTVGVLCDQDGLGHGAQVSLAVQVTFVGPVNTGVIRVQAKAANSDFAYGGKDVKVNHAPPNPTPRWPGLPIAPGLGVSAPASAIATG